MTDWAHTTVNFHQAARIECFLTYRPDESEDWVTRFNGDSIAKKDCTITDAGYADAVRLVRHANPGVGLNLARQFVDALIAQTQATAESYRLCDRLRDNTKEKP
jgi:hypothetical protein